MHEEIAKQFSLKKIEGSEVELTGDVPFEAVAPYRDAALQHIAEHLEMPGFRPGKVPKDMALKKVGEVAVLEEALELFIQHFYPTLVLTHKIDAVGRPDIRVTKLAPNNPVGLVVRAAMYPEVKVKDDWKKLHEKFPVEPLQEVKDEKPEDKSKREWEARDIRRGKLIEGLLERVDVVIPRVFVESELNKIISQMREDVARFGMTYDDYLKRVGKTEVEIRNDFRDQATKRAKLQLALNKIADDEKIVADNTAVEAELKHALEHFKDANPELLKVHIETVLRNEQVLKLLEGTK